MKKVYIHMGPVKTGSTSLQRTFFENREVLEKFGITYLSCRDCDVSLTSAFHRDPLKYGQNKNRRMSAKQIEVRDQNRLSEIVKGIKSSNADTIVLSSEHFPYLSTNELEDFRNYFEPFGTVVAVYFVREFQDWVSSETQELAKIGHAVGPIDAETRFRQIYISAPKNIVSVFGRENAHFINFSEAARTGLLNSFLKTIGKPKIADMGVKEFRVRESISEAAVRALFIYNHVVATVVPFRDMNFVAHISELPGEKYKIAGFTGQAVEEYRKCYDEIEAVTGISLISASELPVSESPDQFSATIEEIFDRGDLAGSRNFRPRDIFTRNTLKKAFDRVTSIILRRERLSPDDIVVLAMIILLMHYAYLILTVI